MVQKISTVFLILCSAICTANAQTQHVTKEQLSRAFKVQQIPKIVKYNQNGRIQEVSADTSVATISPDQAVYTRIGTEVQAVDHPPAEIAATSHLYRLPFGFATTTSDATRTLFLQPIVEIEQGGLQFLDGQYRGWIGVALEDRENRTATTPVSPAVHLSVTADPASTSPTELTIDHTNLPFTRIALATQQNVASVNVKIRTEMDPEASDLAVPVVKPLLILEASPQRIYGFGLAETNLTVSLNQLIDETVVARLTCTAGAPSPQEVTISRGGTATSRLRSAGLGSATVRASTTTFETGDTVVDFVFPTSFLISTLLGGFIGSLASVLLTAKHKRKVSWLQRLIGGVFLGFVAAVLFTVGVNLTGYTFTAKHGEALFFGVSALVSIAGISIFEKKPEK